MRKEEESKIRAYINAPNLNPRPAQDQNRHLVYLITYLGELFIQGYRILDKFGDIIILSLMEFQIGGQLSMSQKRITKKLPPKYKAVVWQYDEKNIFEDAATRKQIFNKAIQVSKCFDDIQYNIVYLHSTRYSILNRKELQRNTQPHCKHYFHKIKWIQQKNGFKTVHEKEQGIFLHQLAQMVLKGAGQARNPQVMKRMQNKNKYLYDLFYVVHTIFYIVGKEILENDYQTISSEKWMRYTTKKKFKRYDLLMRTEEKSCIIDWKFSKLVANEKIRGNGVKNKNRQYYELAYKDFLTDVQLKFYCFHTRLIFNTYHMFTCAEYYHKIPTQFIDNIEEITIQDSSEQENEAQILPQIQIEDNIVSLVQNKPNDKKEESLLVIVDQVNIVNIEVNVEDDTKFVKSIEKDQKNVGIVQNPAAINKVDNLIQILSDLSSLQTDKLQTINENKSAKQLKEQNKGVQIIRKIAIKQKKLKQKFDAKILKNKPIIIQIIDSD